MNQSRRIAVVRFRDEYRIVAADGYWGHFRFRIDAEEAALRLSAKARVIGDKVDVLVQGAFGELTPLDADVDDIPAASIVL
jgi:hypothetical protein